MRDMKFGGVELGGTKTICAVGDGLGNIETQLEIPTRGVNDTMSDISDFFNDNNGRNNIKTIGVASFGPLGINLDASHYGYILKSPKQGWVDINVRGLLRDKTKIPVVVDTDVNCAARGEYYYGNAESAESFAYITVGTGIGGSLMKDGEIIFGQTHSELGHMNVMREPDDEDFEGVCSYHGDCLEGLASGPAMEKRWGIKPEQIDDPRAWTMETRYLARGLGNIALMFRPQMIVVGGGVTEHPDLLRNVRKELPKQIGNYIDLPDMDYYIRKSMGKMNGSLGAIKMAHLAFELINK